VVPFQYGLKKQFAMAADGDARRLLNLLEIATELAQAKNR
jgi:putative ATPase